MKLFKWIGDLLKAITVLLFLDLLALGIALYFGWTTWDKIIGWLL